MKIAFLLNHFLPHQVAGTEVYTWALAKSLQREGHEVIIVIPKYDTDKNDEYSYDGIQVVRYAEANRTDRKLISGKRPPDGIKAFETLIRNENPAIVNIEELNQSSGVGMYHLKVLNILRIPVIVTLHLAGYSCYCGTLMYKDKEPCDGLIRIGKCSRCALNRLPINPIAQQLLYMSSMPLFKLNINTANLNSKTGTAFSYPFIIKNLSERLYQVASYSNRIIVLTDWFKKVLLLNNIPENKIQLIRQGLPYANEIALKTTLKTDNTLRLMFMGRMHPVKGLELLLEVIAGLNENNIVLDIFGEYNQNEYSKKLQQKTIHKKNIHWKGIIEQKHVVSTMQLYDAIIIPSVVCEMAPLLIQEASAAGVPVIGSDVKGIAEQISNGYNGLLFKMGSVNGLKQVIQNILADRSILKKLSENIQLPRSFIEVSKETLLLYKSVLAESKTHTI